MPLSEFGLIDAYFRDVGARADVRTGVGDDGAVLMPPPGQDLVAVVDTLVEGVHFPAGSDARSIGHRALAVNLSDIAAMGATPAWALLALTLPRADESWLAAFTRGFGELARAHGVQLVGGDTTSGPLSVTVQVLGFVPQRQALLRTGARAGDIVHVTGTPGEAACGLALLQGHEPRGDAPAAAIEGLRQRFLFPQPRADIGLRLVGIASACIDISDGLAGDLAKLAQASHCGAEIDHALLPLSDALRACVGDDAAGQYALTGGDDYELCFTVPPARLGALAGLPCTAIGRIVEAPGLRLRRGDNVIEFSHSGFDHFRV